MGERSIEIVEWSPSDERYAAGYLALMNHYAEDRAGGGQSLPDDVRERLIPALRERDDALILLALDADEVVGLANCFEGFSTFAARPLLNLHDLVVHAESRGRGIGTQLLARLSELARERGCCKVTLEVLEGNVGAQALYRRVGFAGYALDSEFGQAMFWQQKID